MIQIYKFISFLYSCRWKSGVASSLNYVTISDEKSPVLHPYPSWKANTLPADQDDQVMRMPTATGGHDNAPKAIVSNTTLLDESSIISTFRIRVDECDRLWVMDTGLSDILGNPKQLAPSGLVIFDLKTDQLIRRYSFSDSDSKEDTFFANVVSFDEFAQRKFKLTF